MPAQTKFEYSNNPCHVLTTATKSLIIFRSTPSILNYNLFDFLTLSLIIYYILIKVF